MKKTTLLLLPVLVLTILVLFCACNDDEVPKPSDYTVTFKLGEEVLTTLSAPEGTSVTPPNAPSKNGFTFEGWKTEDGIAWDSTSHKSGDITVYASLVAKKYTVTFTADGSVVEDTFFTVETDKITPPAVPDKKGYSGTWESFTLGEENITVNAVYTPLTYKITYVLLIDEALNENKTSYTVESESFNIYPLSYPHYNFVGWFTDENFSIPADTVIENGSFGDITFYAKWTPVEYTATFKADGKDVAEIKFTVETDKITPPTVPDKKGYSGTWESFSLTPDNFTVNARYTPIVYTVKYKTSITGVDGGTLATLTIETDTLVLSPIELEKYHFRGWYADEEMTSPISEISKGTATDILIYAMLECKHSYGYAITKNAEILTDGIGTYTCKWCNDSYTEKIPATKSIKLLAIGNSYSIDAMNYLYGILEQAGVEDIKLGNLYIGGCPLDTHWENITNDADAYRLYLSSETKKTMTTATNTASIRYALELEDWDIVTMQQKSSQSGMPEHYGNLQNIIDYVKSYVPDAKLYWHMTWAYSPSRSASYEQYGKTQIGMYNAIVDTVNTVIIPNGSFDGIIPTGTAIQNLRTSLLGDDLTRDDTHLSNGTGRYTAAMIWAKVLTGCDISLIDGTPSNPADNASYGTEINANIVYIREAVNNAYATPFAITNSIYPPTENDEEGDDNQGGNTDNDNTGGGNTDNDNTGGGNTDNGGGENNETVTPPTQTVDFDTTLSDLTEDDISYLTQNGYSPSDYKVLDVIFYDNEFYNSIGSSNRTVGIDSFLNRFVGTQIFSRYELIIGSLIRLDNYQYRPEGWTALDKKTPSANRPDNVDAGLTVVTEEWWGDFNYRAFNLRKSSASVSSEKIISGFRIYVPIVKTEELNQDDIAFLETLDLDASEYKVLNFEYYENQYYNSVSSSSLLTPKQDSSTYARFIGLEMMSRYDLSIGSIIRLGEGYNFRAEGWYDLNEKKTEDERPKRSTDEVTHVTEEWWGSYAYRGINIARGGYTLPDVYPSGIRIYVKIT